MFDHWASIHHGRLGPEGGGSFAGATPLSRREAIARAGIAALGLGLSGYATSAKAVSRSNADLISSDQSWLLDWAGKPVRVNSYAPADMPPDRPVVLALHGTLRNAEGMARNWQPWADLLGLYVIVPEFDERYFPGESYSMGGSTMGTPGERAIDAVALIFQQARTRMGFTADSFGLFGHSAGAQLAHRYLMFADPDSVRAAVVAGAGWYTMPDDETRWPYGLWGTGVELADLDPCWSTKVLLLVGDQDKGRQYLRWTNEARAEGKTRIERGRAYFDRARRVAEQRGISLDWRFELVPGSGHDSARAIDRAASFLA